MTRLGMMIELQHEMILILGILIGMVSGGILGYYFGKISNKTIAKVRI